LPKHFWRAGLSGGIKPIGPVDEVIGKSALQCGSLGMPLQLLPNEFAYRRGNLEPRAAEHDRLVYRRMATNHKSKLKERLQLELRISHVSAGQLLRIVMIK
jgi:hypothetical protein